MRKRGLTKYRTATVARTCSTKSHYPTEEEAAKALADSADPDGMLVYLCPVCLRWAIGHPVVGGGGWASARRIARRRC